MNRVVIQQETHQTRKAIAAFNQVRKIKSLQVNFLKKLCEGKVGKMMSVVALWKNMPEPKNKKRIVKATTFAANLM